MPTQGITATINDSLAQRTPKHCNEFDRMQHR